LIVVIVEDKLMTTSHYTNKNSSADEIANLNVYDDIVHIKARAYAH